MEAIEEGVRPVSRTFNCLDEKTREVGLSSATDAVEAGRLVVIPTDTVYGVGCNAFNPEAVNRLLQAKRRGPDMPVPVLVGSWDTVRGLSRDYTRQMNVLIEAFWPGGLSIVVPQAPSLTWNLGDTNGSVMLRMPLQKLAIELLQKTGPMAVSSANISGQPPALNAKEAEEQLGNSVSVYLEGGQAEIGTPSTIIDLTQATPTILREGAIPSEKIFEVLKAQT